MQPAKVEPQLVVLRTMGQEMRREVNEEVLVFRAKTDEASGENHGSAGVREVEGTATRCKIRQGCIGVLAFLQARPPRVGIERVLQDGGFQQFRRDRQQGHATKLSGAFGVTPQHREQVLEHGVDAGFVVHALLEVDQQPPCVGLREIIEQGLSSMLLRPVDVS